MIIAWEMHYKPALLTQIYWFKRCVCENSLVHMQEEEDIKRRIGYHLTSGFGFTYVDKTN